METVFPNEAIDLATARAAAYETGGNDDIDALVADFMTEIRPVLDNRVVQAVEYLHAVRGPLRLQADVAEMPEPALPDKLEEPHNQRRVNFLRAIVSALSDEARARGAAS